MFYSEISSSHDKVLAISCYLFFFSIKMYQYVKKRYSKFLMNGRNFRSKNPLGLAIYCKNTHTNLFSEIKPTNPYFNTVKLIFIQINEKTKYRKQIKK